MKRRKVKYDPRIKKFWKHGLHPVTGYPVDIHSKVNGFGDPTVSIKPPNKNSYKNLKV